MSNTTHFLAIVVGFAYGAIFLILIDLLGFVWKNNKKKKLKESWKEKK